MNAAADKQLFRVCYPRLPLAVYREIAAHLQQVEGIGVELISQSSQKFDYDDSQIGSLQIKYLDNLEPFGQQRVEEILAYYSQLYGEWVELK
ncbi:MAG: hypothetical protein KME17_04025 [Cyanosarcina radialis HA8281-LM2]|jgi:hypothetical protein|nr:hypothetical protein [Cyanosarcina radialis HA8281-LM2]